MASIGDSFSAFFDAVGDFLSNLAAVNWLSLLLALVAFGVYLSLRAFASYNILRAAYPDERFGFMPIWGAYFAGYGFNSVVPARGGDVIRLFLTKTSIPNSSYPAVAAAFSVEFIYDLVIAVPVLTFAFTQGVFPKPPDFSKLPAFDLAFFASHPRFALFVITVLGLLAMVGLRAAVGARARVLGAGAPGADDPVRPPPLPARGVRGPVRGLAVPLHRVLAAAGRVRRRRLGAQRAARARRQRGGGLRAVHPRRRRRAAGAAGEGVRRHRDGRDRGGLLGRPADRDRGVHVRRRLRRDRVRLQVPLLQGGDRPRTGVTRRGGARAKPDPGAPRAPA